MVSNTTQITNQMNRREFVKLGGGAVAVLATGIGGKTRAGRRGKPKPKNVVLI